MIVILQKNQLMTNNDQINESVPAADNMLPTSREHSSDKTRCLVTFRLPGEAAPDATSVAAAESFNDWSADRHPMKRLENGDFSLALELEAGKEYEFRFVIDGVRWENAWNADKYAWSDHGNCENSIIVT